ncbi:S66 peptidase family protein [Candidatus Absconditicoccus praedator]|uniref:S66 peptidase family protein n=1 Tax=Candidatus Absconditicoccus praedator TaxID=2735562 RepID=UPI001E4F69E0|nr:S66 peptidase family protein [Candidatus Absconditicoccus praedator]UFX82935.1 LD-carboxypeptidase [Candidatus Absconditicoccus praedator]
MKTLNPGDSIGIVSISNQIDPEKLDSYGFLTFQRILEKHLGVNIKIGKNILRGVEGVKPEKRAEDINRFIADPDIKMIWPIGGGAFSNEILPYIDWDGIKEDNKIICGYSDINALNNALYAKTGIPSFSGPTPGNFSLFRYGSLETFLYFYEMVVDGKEVDLSFHDFYFDFSVNQEENPWQIINDGGLKIVNKGKSTGTIVGGNISTFSLLIGTEFMPDLEGKVLFLEECPEENIGSIRRMLIQLKNQPKFDKIAGVVFGRINQACMYGYDITWEGTVNDFARDLNVPVVMNAQFGHISPIQTFPIGGKIDIDTKKGIYKMSV